MPENEIKTAVFPVAGLGTRFLPITKTGPKEMLPIVDMPIIQYAVREAISARMNHLVFVTSSEKRSIEDYFDRNLELEMWLEQQGKMDALQTVKNIIPSNIAISYVRQPIPLGLGHAIWCAKHVVGDQPFAVLLPDDIIDCQGKSCMQAMVEQYCQTGSSVIAVEQVEKEDVNKYGIVALAPGDQGQRIINMVEKPSIAQAPSQLAVIGRYILMPQIFALLERTAKGAGGEIQLTDAIVAMLQKEKVYAHLVKGRRFDCGDKLGMLKATMVYALKRPDMRDALLNFFSESLIQYHQHQKLPIEID